MATVSGNTTVFAKRDMLNAWREPGRGLEVFLENAGQTKVLSTTNGTDPDSVSIAWGTTTGSKLTISANVPVDVLSGSDGADAVKFITVQATSPNTTAQLVFEIPTAIEFPAGGTLTITAMDVELIDN